MTLEQLQVRTLKFLRQCRRQFNHLPHEQGMTDIEFIEDVLNPFKNDILSDRDVLRMAAEREKAES